ncbi:30S ribosomal protein S1, chloroplastic [Tetrabaena socialis]|uniref:30S ribosomal protein S1, chloroplastic n=1 Tax=Tetrabaena socialis TaxID=47790 RepID=A0A2J8AF80_9CHLO|nr:30S ribosomal protein S1, chloroplastic [Tetrabaena socialis]|eukprot:PNH11175.1 30S ribosomal protein S1, chloroplastic [Tetrabaena socialis]
MRGQALALLSVAQRNVMPELCFAAACRRTLTALAPHSGGTATRVGGTEEQQAPSPAASVRAEPSRTWGPARLSPAFRTFAAAANDQPAAACTGPALGDVVSGVVVSVDPKLQVRIDLGEGSLPGLLRLSQVSQLAVSRLDAIFKEGDRVKALVRRVDSARGCLHLSTRELEPTPGGLPWAFRAFGAVADGQLATATTASGPVGLTAGDVVSGVVRSVEASFGVHIDLDGGGPPGMLHISQVSQEHVARLDAIFKEGDKVKALVRKLDKGRNRVELSTKGLEATPGDMLRNPQLVYDKAEETAERLRSVLPKDGDLVAGVVLSLTNFGAFVDLGGAVGMLHKSRISQELVGSAKAALKVGDKIKVLVSCLDGPGRFDLSTKELEPAPGDMLHNPQLVYDKAEETYEQLRKRQA